MFSVLATAKTDSIFIHGTVICYIIESEGLPKHCWGKGVDGVEERLTQFTVMKRCQGEGSLDLSLPERGCHSVLAVIANIVI